MWALLLRRSAPNRSPRADPSLCDRTRAPQGQLPTNTLFTAKRYTPQGHREPSVAPGAVPIHRFGAFKGNPKDEQLQYDNQP